MFCVILAINFTTHKGRNFAAKTQAEEVIVGMLKAQMVAYLCF